MTSKLETVTQNIQTSAIESGRKGDDITLVAVSKTKPVEDIIPLLDQGHRIFGENKVQEAAGKWPDLRSNYNGVKLHLIGPLQSNKVRQAIHVFDVIETLDRPKLARALSRISQEENISCPCYIQINIGHEDQKAGIAPEQADAFITLCRVSLSLPVIGLMCIPPSGQDPAPYFRQLKEIAERNGLGKLSMGMSSDYQTAVRSGATSVRVGTALFGARF
ncbi:MAG: YggS family pyridoxal phosphate-dependent enzyme [Alphaproteobacteria bacterium]|nr:MAG: YggS family pyridoxal phosphate-dependent enzyme [Alphaproteobacteria bacterium]